MRKDISLNRLLLIGAITFLAMGCVIAPPIPAPLVNGTFYYRNITPQNDPFDLRVNPGDTLYLGRAYDLSYVSGYSKAFAWWKNPNDEAVTCTPDLVINTSYIDTGGRVDPRAVWIDPSVWKEGNWYQWEGCYSKYNFKTGEKTWVPYIADNNLAFKVSRPPSRVTPTQTGPVRETLRTVIGPVFTNAPRGGSVSAPIVQGYTGEVVSGVVVDSGSGRIPLSITLSEPPADPNETSIVVTLVPAESPVAKQENKSVLPWWAYIVGAGIVIWVIWRWVW